MRFEKWQALGNDYLIVERANLPAPLTPETVRRLCDPHFGVGADGVLELSPPDEPGYVARLRIFNPDGSEAELSGNGAREAILYLRHRGWTQADTFSIQTAAGEIRPTITGPTTCRVDMGRASLTSKDYPGGPPDGTGEVAGYAFQHVSIGNPQCAIVVEEGREELDLRAIGPDIEADDPSRSVEVRHPDQSRGRGPDNMGAGRPARGRTIMGVEARQPETTHLGRRDDLGFP